MIEVNNIHKYFGTNHVLRGLTFSVPRGCVTGLVGPNGSGKSTTIRALTGYIDTDEGSISYDGSPISVNSSDVKRMFGYVPESAPSYRELTVFEYLNFIANIRGLSNSNRKQELEHAIDAFSLASVARQAIGTLSKGYRHRVSLAQCLLGDPPCIILDEPTDGLDPIQKIETRKIITNLSETKAVLLTTHLLEEVELLCDRVIAMNNGNIVFSGDMNEINASIMNEEIIHFKLFGINEDTFKNITRSLTTIKNVSSSSVNGYLVGSINLAVNAESKNSPIELLSHILFEANIRVCELSKESVSLQDCFQFWSHQTS